MKITIIGCGNAGLINAAKLIESNNSVALLKTSEAANNEFFDIICNEGGYNVKDETDGGRRFFVKPAFITRDVEKAVRFGDVIMVMTTTSQHENQVKCIKNIN